MVKGIGRKGWIGEPKKMLTVQGLVIKLTGEFRRREKT